MNRKIKIISLLLLSLSSLCCFEVYSQTSVFSDDFSTNQSSDWTVSGQINSSSWYVQRSGIYWGGRRNTSPAQLELTNIANFLSGTPEAGWVFAYLNTSGFSSPYNKTLANNKGIITWSFNMRHIRSDPAGFASGNYGVAFILCGSSTSISNTGTGYAVILGQSGTTDPIRLARYSGGVNPDSKWTNIITSNTSGLTDFGNEYLSVKVTYNPSNSKWELFLRNDGSSSFTNPETGLLTSQGTATDNTYTSTSFDYTGAYWQGNTDLDQTAFFDNIKISVSAPPSKQVSRLTWGTLPGNKMGFSWNSGNGTGCIFLMKAGSRPTNPIHGTTYTFNNDFSSAYELEAGGTRVVHFGSNSKAMLEVSGLNNETIYYFKVLEYSGSGYYLTYNTDEVSGYNIGNSDESALPVEIISFTGKNQDNKVYLNWQTASELNNSGFEVQRSYDAKDFEILAFISGAGNSNTLQNYTYTDFITPHECSYYRLKQNDYDGAFSFSSIISVNAINEYEKAASPYYEAGNLFIPFNEEFNSFNVLISDVSGRVVFSRKLVTTSFPQAKINLPYLSKGLYMLMIYNDSRFESARFIIK